MQQTKEWRNVDMKMFREQIIPLDRPAVLKGAVNDWPLVRAAAESPQALLEYVRPRDLGRPVQFMLGHPEIKGLFFYRDDMSGLNFQSVDRQFHAALESIIGYMNHPDPPTIYTGAATVQDNFPQIRQENILSVLDRPARVRMWLGNAATAATHYDMPDGINCMIAGRKCFTFFPPDQLPNLYVGPLELAPGGQPTSLVKVSAPDLERFPRFARALEVAETAYAEPGDAVFIPNLWWHNVESLEPLNLSMSWMWYDTVHWAAEPFAALAHSLLALTPLPANRRSVWRQIFDHYVFRTEGDPVPYLPPDRRGMLGPMSPELERHIRTQLVASLSKPMPRDLALAERNQRMASGANITVGPAAK